MTLPEKIEARLADLAALPANWNSYGAKPITPWAIDKARWLLETCMPAERDRCQIVPRNNGGIELTWDGERLIYSIPPADGGNYEICIETPEPWGLEAFLAMVR